MAVSNTVQDPRMNQQQYVRLVLDCYRRTPETVGHVRPADRRMAIELYKRRIPLSVVKAALILATARRMFRPPESAPLATVRSMHYFVPVIDEILNKPLHPDYVQYLRSKIDKQLDRQRGEAGYNSTP